MIVPTECVKDMMAEIEALKAKLEEIDKAVVLKNYGITLEEK